MEIKCPRCNIVQKQKPEKSWGYGKRIQSRTKKETKYGPSVNCSRYLCKCGKPFNLYLTVKGKQWTIPKKQTNPKNK